MDKDKACTHILKSRHSIQVKGTVQGVGFRPFVYSIAKALGLTGFVLNDGQGVNIEVQGDINKLEHFRELLVKEAPVPSYIAQIKWCELNTKEDHSFAIKPSITSLKPETYISPDMALCQTCKAELLRKADRHYHYPFINCTRCGPRFTIIQTLPYDRVNTTMSKFKLCPICQREYENPSDRRFHAEPTSCRACGPQLRLVNSLGQQLGEGKEIQVVGQLLKAGHIVAIKGLGGYHLACPINQDAIRRLREKKKRDQRPFAIMVKDVQTAAQYGYISERERELLLSPKAPIVLLNKKASCLQGEYIAPHTPTIGVMLPYTPVHELLFEDEIESLIMTSGNLSGESIYYTDEVAWDKLRGVADYFLMHNRKIHTGIDDSITRIVGEKEYVLRRARGYVPFPLDLSFLLSQKEKNEGEIPHILACGGEQKNTFCLTKKDKAFMSQHIGDLKHKSSLDFFEENIARFKCLFGIFPQIIAYDLHPDYLSTDYALAQKQPQKEGIQHHHAHIAACCVDNQVLEPVIGVAFDGTGCGEDGHIWGGEFFVGDYAQYKRVAHLQYVKILGGEKAIDEPWRMALSYLLHIEKDGEMYLEESQRTFLGAWKQRLCSNRNIKPVEDVLQCLSMQWENSMNAPLGSSMGRLFDTVSALMGLCERANYEAEGAIWLESLASTHGGQLYPYGLKEDEQGMVIIDVYHMLIAILESIVQGISYTHIATTFHHTIMHLTSDVCVKIRSVYDIKSVALSGGVFQNKILLEGCIEHLTRQGFKVYTHSKVPANDGGIALGQSAITLMRWLRKREEHRCV